MTFLLAALLAATAFASAQGDGVARTGSVDLSRLILRLSDLPPRYLNLEFQEEQGERILCSRLHSGRDTPPGIAKLVDRFHPKGCIAAYRRLFTVPGQSSGPVVVGTGVLPMSSRKAADVGWNVVPELLGQLTNSSARQVATAERVGSATELFHANKPPHFYPYPIQGEEKVRTSFLVWRSGNTLAAVMTIGESFAEADTAAIELAQRQQAHIRKPTPYTRAERFDGEVALDDPAVDLPVYWLGRNFRPGQGLPDNRLYGSDFSGEAVAEEDLEFGYSEAPESPLGLGYENIWLHTWAPATWSVFADSKTGRAITSWHCTKARTVVLPEGTATIFGGYKENFRRCPKEGPRAFTAWVDIGGVKVVVDSPPAADFIETVNPYGSFAGMEAIVRGLQLRPKPVYATTSESR